MGNQKNKFNPVAIRNISNLRYVVASNIEAKKSAYYLIVNQWDDACKYFNDRLDWDTPATEDSIDLNVIFLIYGLTFRTLIKIIHQTTGIPFL